MDDIIATTLNDDDAFEYLKTLGQSTLNELYEDPWTVQAVFQSLPSLSKVIIMRLLYSNDPSTSFSLDEKKSLWLNSKNAEESHNAYEDSVEKLKTLGIIIFNSNSNTQCTIHPVFQQQLLAPLNSSSSNASPFVSNKKVSVNPTVVEEYGQNQWDKVLNFMVGSSTASNNSLPTSVVDILLKTSLMTEETESSRLHITNTGYEFMLKNTHAQLWVFIKEYIRTLTSVSTAVTTKDILSFLFQLSCVGNANTVIDLKCLDGTPAAYLVQDFVDFGLLYRPPVTKKKSSAACVITTSLGTNLIYGGKGTANKTSSASSSLSLVIETNFKIYAYTTSSLHVAMLSVFVDIVATLPNLTVGFITRESLRSALLHGISARNIYDFLSNHQKFKNTVIPENVADQIFLWERERNRISYHNVVLLDGFDSKDEYQKVLQYIKSQNVLRWTDDQHYKIAFSQSKEKEVKHFIKSQR